MANLSGVFDDADVEESSAIEVKSGVAAKRKSNVVAGLNINFDEDSDSDSDSACNNKSAKKKGATPAKKKGATPAKKKKTGHIDGMTVEQHRRKLGDQVKSKLKVLGGRDAWGIAASCHVVLSCSTQLFRALVLPCAAKVTPGHIGEDTEVVLAEVVGTAQVGLPLISMVSRLHQCPQVGPF